MKKSRSLVAMLMAIVLLLSVSAVSAFAADETVTSVLDFTTLTPGEDFAAVTAAVKGLGAVDCVNLVVGDCYNPTLTGKGYNGEGYFIQKIEAGEGKVFAEAPVVTLNYRITNADPLGYIKVQGSIDGVTYYDFANLNTATGDAWTAEAKATADVVLNGGEGSSTVWVKVSMQHWGGPDAACVDKCTVTGKVQEGTGNVPVIPENQISSEVNFEALSEFGHIDNPSKGDPAATKAKMEELGLIIPERIGWFEAAEDDVNHDWVLQSCYHVFLTPFDGYQNCAYIQKLEAGEGKVLEADAKLTLKYWLAVVGDPSYIVVEVSTDGQTWNEVWANEEGQGQEYNANACTEQQIALPGTAGAATVYVKIVVNRHSGATSGGVTKSVITGTTKEAEIPACQHTNTTVEGAKDATCTEAGFTGNTVCADCGEQIAAGEEIAVLEHTYADGACTACGAADPDYVPGESKTITIGDKTFTAAAGKWIYNTAITAADAAKYGMIIFDKGFEGSFETNGWGAAIVLDGEGKLVKIYDGANGGFHTVDGKSTDPLTFTTANYAVVAFSELQDGEMLIIFPNDGVNAPDSARSFALGLRNGYCGQTATVTGFTFDEEPEGPSETVDLIGIAVAMMAASGTALVCLKKKED